MLSTNDVLNRHLQSFAERDVNGILSDYAPDAVLFVPTGPLTGPNQMRPLFENLVAEFSKPGATFNMQQRSIDGDYAYIVWNAETADNTWELATDTFVVKDGKITVQSFAAKVTPKV